MRHVLAGVGHTQRQVAGDRLGPRLVQAAVELQPAGAVRLLPAAGQHRVAPGAAELGAEVVVGDARLAQPQLDAGRPPGPALQPPVEVGADALQRHPLGREHPGQADAAVVDPQAGLAAAFVGLQLQVDPFQPRAAEVAGLGGGRRGQPQALQAALHLVAQRRLGRTVPAQLKALRLALRSPVRQALHQRVAQRQAVGQFGQHGQRQPVGAGLAGQRLAGLLPPADAEPAARPLQPLVGGKGQVLARQPGPVVGLLRAEAALHALQAERSRGPRPLQRQAVQRQVHGDAARLAAHDVEPGPQRAVALDQPEGQVRRQRREVGLRQLGVHGAVPTPPVAGRRPQRLLEGRAHGEALAEAGGRGVQPQPVRAQAVAQHQVHVVEGQRRGARRRGVLPLQPAAAHHHLVLVEQPVGGGVAVLAGAALQRQAGHPPAAVGVAPQRQLGVLQQQLFELQPPRPQQVPQPAGGQRRRHLRQTQRRLAVAVVQAHVAQRQHRHPAGGGDLDPADGHRHAERGRGTGLHLGSPVVDAGQNAPVQRQPAEQQYAPDQRDDRQRQLQRQAGAAEGPGRRPQGGERHAACAPARRWGRGRERWRCNRGFKILDRVPNTGQRH
ncbi:hypothetical protein [Aquabacterium sp. J223]|uniref:hypothetical protein n=1 Tax=Aquabacterium sp. J223 TaxID=2898431 RepID=UPI0021ADDBD5|nr:hypothetical protein [Aquabacterium sp. J223]UUX97964.1 hypothetical protein LRS07_00680 [Aquabacterium sp. J223]